MSLLTAMKPKVYIETSIPSFYYEARTEPDMVARRNWTREWCVMLGLFVPTLVTPLELIGAQNDEE